MTEVSGLQVSTWVSMSPSTGAQAGILIRNSKQKEKELRENRLYKIGTRALALLMTLWTLQGCDTNDSDENLSNDKVAVDLTLCVSPQLASPVTRQPADQTDDPQTDIPQIHGGFRGIQGIQAGDPLVTLIPLSHEDNVFSTIIPSLIEKNVSSTYRHYITSYFTELNIGTEKFLCYAKATPLTSADEADDAKRTFKNGSIVPTLSDKQPANIRFDLDPICPDPDNSGYDVAASLADYLTTIAKAGGWYEVADGKAKEYFDDFTNNSSPIAGSSANLRKWVEIFNEKIAESSIEETLRNAIITAIDFANIETHIPTSTTYPENIYLPAGAAAMKWSRTLKKFEVMKESDSDSPLSDHKRFTYPAELYYYSYSPIKTSLLSWESYYSSLQWEGVLDYYENDDALVSSTTRSVAIKKALNYGVCCMIATLKAVDKSDPEILPTELYDNSETPVAIPLTNADTGKPSFR